MKYGSLILEKKEYVYLKRILNISGYVGDNEAQKSLTKLSEELKTAHIVDEENMPIDIVRFNSYVDVVSDQGWERSFQVVMPVDEDVKENKISILSLIGSALLGTSKDDTVNLSFPNGNEKLKITNVSHEETYSGIDVTF